LLATRHGLPAKAILPRHLAAKVREVLDEAVQSPQWEIGPPPSCRITAVTAPRNQAFEQKYLPAERMRGIRW